MNRKIGHTAIQYGFLENGEKELLVYYRRIANNKLSRMYNNEKDIVEIGDRLFIRLYEECF